jgi:hypothetical protein
MGCSYQEVIKVIDDLTYSITYVYNPQKQLICELAISKKDFRLFKYETSRFAEKMDGSKGIIPEILMDLLSARKKYKKMMEGEKDIFKKSIFLTYMPFLSLLILLCLVSLFSPYQVIISRRYFWGGLILFYIVGKLILIVLHIRKAKKELPRYLQAEWIKTNLTNGFVLTFMLLLVICAILMICKEKKAADFVAIVGYILLACSLVMRLVKLKKES